MSLDRDIPGFYFDNERKKYFRIQPNHRAPEGAAHSRSAVNAKSEAVKIEKDVRTRHSRREDGCIDRLERSSFTNLCLESRHGAYPQRYTENLARHFARSLKCRTVHQNADDPIESIVVSNDSHIYATTYQGGGFFEILELSSKTRTEGEVFLNMPSSMPKQALIYSNNGFAIFSGRFCSTIFYKPTS